MVRRLDKDLPRVLEVHARDDSEGWLDRRALRRGRWCGGTMLGGDKEADLSGADDF